MLLKPGGGINVAAICAKCGAELPNGFADLATHQCQPKVKPSNISKEDQMVAYASITVEWSKEKDMYFARYLDTFEYVGQGWSQETAVTVLKLKRALAISSLTERQKYILSLRFGLEDGHARTLEEVGQILGITRERIRQIEESVFRRLQRLNMRLFHGDETRRVVAEAIAERNNEKRKELASHKSKPVCRAYLQYCSNDTCPYRRLKGGWDYKFQTGERECPHCGAPRRICGVRERENGLCGKHLKYPSVEIADLDDV